MPNQVVAGALMSCSFGVAPVPLAVLPDKMIVAPAPAANIMDHKPIVNIATFGMCSSLANPTVASATAAALGVLTPMPCLPNTVAPWAPGATKVTLKNMPALHDACKLNCMWGGIIQFSMAGQMKTSVK